MMGLSVVQAIHAIGAQSVALATGYYDQTWVRRYAEFVTESGLHITSDQSFTDQGHFTTADDAFAASFDGFSDDMVSASIRQLAEDDPAADAILVPGMPGPILPLVPTLENTIGRPVISYFAIWWKARARLGLGPLHDHGRLLAAA